MRVGWSLDDASILRSDTQVQQILSFLVMNVWSNLKLRPPLIDNTSSPNQPPTLADGGSNPLTYLLRP